jgi:hypothetical protein
MKTGNVVQDFEWSRVNVGYRWHETPHGPVLVVADGPADTGRRRYAPFSEDYARLFRTFAATEPTREGVLGFANLYGLLGPPVGRVFHPDGRVDALPVDALRHPYVGEGLLSSRGFVGELLEAPDQSDPWSWVAQIKDLRAFLELADAKKSIVRLPLLERLASRYLSQTVGYRLVAGGDENTLHLRLGPHSLIGVLWFQAVQSLAYPTKFVPCRVCAVPIEISRSPTGTRSDAMFCSNKCKSRDYRARRAEARVLAGRGMKTSEIATKLRTTPPTTRKWLRKT